MMSGNEHHENSSPVPPETDITSTATAGSSEQKVTNKLPKSKKQNNKPKNKQAARKTSVDKTLRKKHKAKSTYSVSSENTIASKKATSDGNIWVSLGVLKCGKCGFTTTDQAMFNVHICNSKRPTAGQSQSVKPSGSRGDMFVSGTSMGKNILAVPTSPIITGLDSSAAPVSQLGCLPLNVTSDSATYLRFVHSTNNTVQSVPSPSSQNIQSPVITTPESSLGQPPITFLPATSHPIPSVSSRSNSESVEQTKDSHGSIQYNEDTKKFTCLLCKYSSVDSNSLTEHIMYQFTPNPYNCPHCKQGFPSRAEFQTHFLEKHKGKKVECKLHVKATKKILANAIETAKLGKPHVFPLHSGFVRCLTRTTASVQTASSTSSEVPQSSSLSKQPQFLVSETNSSSISHKMDDQMAVNVQGPSLGNAVCASVLATATTVSTNFTQSLIVCPVLQNQVITSRTTSADSVVTVPVSAVAVSQTVPANRSSGQNENYWSSDLSPSSHVADSSGLHVLQTHSYSNPSVSSHDTYQPTNPQSLVLSTVSEKSQVHKDNSNIVQSNTFQLTQRQMTSSPLCIQLEAHQKSLTDQSSHVAQNSAAENVLEPHAPTPSDSVQIVGQSSTVTDNSVQSSVSQGLADTNIVNTGNVERVNSSINCHQLTEISSFQKKAKYNYLFDHSVQNTSISNTGQDILHNSTASDNDVPTSLQDSGSLVSSDTNIVNCRDKEKSSTQTDCLQLPGTVSAESDAPDMQYSPISSAPSQSPQYSSISSPSSLELCSTNVYSPVSPPAQQPDTNDYPQEPLDLSVAQETNDCGVNETGHIIAEQECVANAPQAEPTLTNTGTFDGGSGDGNNRNVANPITSNSIRQRDENNTEFVSADMDESSCPQDRPFSSFFVKFHNIYACLPCKKKCTDKQEFYTHVWSHLHNGEQTCPSCSTEYCLKTRDLVETVSSNVDRKLFSRLSDGCRSKLTPKLLGNDQSPCRPGESEYSVSTPDFDAQPVGHENDLEMLSAGKIQNESNESIGVKSEDIYLHPSPSTGENHTSDLQINTDEITVSEQTNETVQIQSSGHSSLLHSLSVYGTDADDAQTFQNQSSNRQTTGTNISKEIAYNIINECGDSSADFASRMGVESVSVSNMGPDTETVSNMGPENETASNMGPEAESASNMELVSNIGPETETASSIGPETEISSNIIGSEIEISSNMEPASNIGPETETASNIGPEIKAVSNIGPGTESPSNMTPGTDSASNMGPEAESASNIGSEAESASNMGPEAESASNIGPEAESASNIGPEAESASNIGPEAESTSNMGPKAEFASNMGPEAESASNMGPKTESASNMGPEAESASNIEFVSNMELETDYTPNMGTGTKSASHTEPDNVSVSKNGPETESASNMETETESTSNVGPEIASNMEHESNIGPETETASNIGPETETASNIGPETETASSVGPETESAFNTGPEAESASNMEPASNIGPETESETASNIGPETETASNIETETASNIGPETETASNIGPETALSIGPETETASNIGLETETALSIGLETETASNIGSEITSNMVFEIETASNIGPESETETASNMVSETASNMEPGESASYMEPTSGMRPESASASNVELESGSGNNAVVLESEETSIEAGNSCAVEGQNPDFQTTESSAQSTVNSNSETAPNPSNHNGDNWLSTNQEPEEKRPASETKQSDCHFAFYVCTLCKFNCDTAIEFTMHLNFEHHDERSFPCYHCNYLGHYTTDLTNHINDHTSGDSNIYVCPAFSCGCSFKTDSLHSLRHHIDDHKDCSMFRCNRCESIFSEAAEFLQHAKENSIILYTCTKCASRFLEKSAIQRHWRGSHSGGLVFRVMKILLCFDRKKHRYQLPGQKVLNTQPSKEKCSESTTVPPLNASHSVGQVETTEAAQSAVSVDHTVNALVGLSETSVPTYNTQSESVSHIENAATKRSEGVGSNVVSSESEECALVQKNPVSNSAAEDTPVNSQILTQHSDSFVSPVLSPVSENPVSIEKTSQSLCSQSLTPELSHSVLNAESNAEMTAKIPEESNIRNTFESMSSDNMHMDSKDVDQQLKNDTEKEDVAEENKWFIPDETTDNSTQMAFMTSVSQQNMTAPDSFGEHISQHPSLSSELPYTDVENMINLTDLFGSTDLHKILFDCLYHANNNLFCCNVCDMEFGLLKHVHDHLFSTHAKVSLYSCHYCSEKNSIVRDLRKHISNTHPGCKVVVDCFMVDRNRLFQNLEEEMPITVQKFFSICNQLKSEVNTSNSDSPQVEKSPEFSGTAKNVSHEDVMENECTTNKEGNDKIVDAICASKTKNSSSEKPVGIASNGVRHCGVKSSIIFPHTEKAKRKSTESREEIPEHGSHKKVFTLPSKPHSYAQFKQTFSKQEKVKSQKRPKSGSYIVVKIGAMNKLKCVACGQMTLSPKAMTLHLETCPYYIHSQSVSEQTTFARSLAQQMRKKHDYKHKTDFLCAQTSAKKVDLTPKSSTDVHKKTNQLEKASNDADRIKESVPCSSEKSTCVDVPSKTNSTETDKSCTKDNESLAKTNSAVVNADNRNESSSAKDIKIFEEKKPAVVEPDSSNETTGVKDVQISAESGQSVLESNNPNKKSNASCDKIVKKYKSCTKTDQTPVRNRHTVVQPDNLSEDSSEEDCFAAFRKRKRARVLESSDEDEPAEQFDCNSDERKKAKYDSDTNSEAAYDTDSNIEAGNDADIDDQTEGTFNCKFCDFSATTSCKDELENHLKIKHRHLLGLIKCGYCGNPYGNSMILEKHIKFCHPGKANLQEKVPCYEMFNVNGKENCSTKQVLAQQVNRLRLNPSCKRKRSIETNSPVITITDDEESEHEIDEGKKLQVNSLRVVTALKEAARKVAERDSRTVDDKAETAVSLERNSSCATVSDQGLEKEDVNKVLVSNQRELPMNNKYKKFPVLDSKEFTDFLISQKNKRKESPNEGFDTKVDNLRTNTTSIFAHWESCVSDARSPCSVESDSCERVKTSVVRPCVNPHQTEPGTSGMEIQAPVVGYCSEEKPSKHGGKNCSSNTSIDRSVVSIRAREEHGEQEDKATGHLHLSGNDPRRHLPISYKTFLSSSSKRIPSFASNLDSSKDDDKQKRKQHKKKNRASKGVPKVVVRDFLVDFNEFKKLLKSNGITSCYVGASSRELQSLFMNYLPSKET